MSNNAYIDGQQIQDKWDNGRTKRELPAGSGVTSISLSSCTVLSISRDASCRAVSHIVYDNFIIDGDEVCQRVGEPSP